MTRPVTKQQFLNALACPTMAYLDRQQPAPTLDAGAQWLMWVGNRVGELAREALGPGRMLPPPFSDNALPDSTSAIAAGTSTLFEASMQAGQMFARADALIPRPGGWELVEVKSGKMPDDGKAKAEYLDDIAYTLLVAQLAGVPVVRATLMLLSREHKAGANTPLFGRLDVTDAAMKRAAEMRGIGSGIVALIAGPTKPTPGLRLACKDCGYFETACIGVGVNDSLLRVPRISAKKLAELSPCERIGELQTSVTFTDAQQQAVELIRSRGVLRNGEVLAELSSIQWPAFYLDFETVMPALPWFPGDGAYTTMPNQFSVHVCESPGVVTSHREYLAPLGADWRREIAEQLLAALDGVSSIVVYSSYEKTQLSAMANRFPDLEPQVQKVLKRLFDLERFFKSGYVDHRYAGTSSIKNVLPVLVPDLSYKEMAVGNGSVAAGVFCLMREGVTPSDQHAARRRELLDYCELDTLAMVRLHEALLRV